MNFYAFHIGDYVSATAHLTWDEDMAYRRLLDSYYSREAPIPVDQRQAYRLARASTQEQREAVDSVLQEFFEETESGWFHARCESEIHAVAGKREKASQSAKARWRNANAMPTQSERNANAQETPCERIENECEGNAPIPTPNPIKDQKQKTLVPSDDATGDYSIEFEQFWKAYPKRDGGNSKRAAFKAWKARLRAGVKSYDLILSANRYAEQMAAQGRIGTSFVKQASTFLGPDDHWQEVMTSNVHPIAIVRNGNRPALKPGQWYHPDWNDKDPSTHTICSEETHERATSYAFAWLKKQAWYKP
jgi:uncharacterized protein YdaU (DUF1376 family)